MFDIADIPQENVKIKQLLNDLYGKTGATADQKSVIDKKLSKVHQVLSEKIVTAPTISEYFDRLWKHEDLKEQHKETVIKKLEAIQKGKRIQIINADQPVAKTSANIEAITSKFKMTAFEEYNMNQKVEEVKKKKNLVLESFVMSNSVDPDVLHSLNKPFRSVQHFKAPSVLHYSAGVYGLEEPDALKNMKAEEFVKKIQEEKKNFARKMKQIEKTAEERENEQLERLRKKLQEEQEQKYKEKLERAQTHIRTLKAGAETREKNMNEWKEEYKKYLGKKPLYKEIEDNFKKGVLLPELNEKKRRLQEIRDFHKPIRIDELLEHEQKVKKALEEQEMKKKLAEAKWTYQKPSFESNHHKTFAEETKNIRRQKEEDKLEKIRKKERVMELMQEIKEKHLPTVDPEKEMEIMKQIQELNKRNQRSKTQDSDERLEEYNKQKQLGNDYLSQVRESIKKRGEKVKALDDTAVTKKTDKKDTTNSIKSEATALKKRNYLVDLRKENLIHSENNQVEKIIKNKELDYSQKKELLNAQVSKLEEKAKRMEIMKKYTNKKKADEDDDGVVDEMYINAIKAKLEMLAH